MGATGAPTPRGCVFRDEANSKFRASHFREEVQGVQKHQVMTGNLLFPDHKEAWGRVILCSVAEQGSWG